MNIAQIRTRTDVEFVKSALAAAKIEYATPAHAENDFRSKSIRFYGLKDEGRLVAICSVVPDKIYNYNAIKRLIVLNPADRGKGYAKKLVATIINRQNGACGCTPWEDNKPMQKMLASLGFTYQYTFNNFWTFWKIEA